VNKNRFLKAKSGTGKFDRIKKVICCAAMKTLTQILKHVEQSTVHGTISLRKELLIDGLISKVKIPHVTIVGNAIALYPISRPLKLAAACLVLQLPLHLTQLLVNQEVFRQLPRLLPDVTQSSEQLVDLEVWTLVFFGGGVIN
jgi:hypothetical protein